jgi:ABC-type branched-subunit amino acid transport system substrate-binding protein
LYVIRVAELDPTTRLIFNRFQDAGLANIFVGHAPQAVVMIGAYAPLAVAVHSARANYSASNVVFLTVSFVGADSFRQHLQVYNESFSNIIVSQVVPPPRATTHPILSQYRDALQTYYPAASPNFVSLEGYLVGQFVIEAMSRIRGPITSDNFLNAIYSSSVFYIGGLTLGPYSDNVTGAPCNQGLRQIFLTTIATDGNYTLLPNFNFQWETCLSSTSTLLNANRVKWGQTAAFTGPTRDLGIGMNQGILAAFYEANRNDALRGVFMDLVALDDGYNPGPAGNNTVELLTKHRVFGLIGSVGTPTANAIMAAMASVGSTAPYVGAFTGARTLRDPFKRNVINVRASYIDETASMINYLTNKLISRISIFYQNDAFGLAGLEGLSLAMNASGLVMESMGIYERNTLNISAGMTQVLSRNPEAIVMVRYCICAFVPLIF